MPKQKLDLLQFTTGHVAHSCATASQIVGCEPVDPSPLRTAFHHVPNHVLCHPGTPQRPILPNRSEQSSFAYAGGSRPTIDGSLYPFRYGDGANVAALSYQIDNRPMLFPLLKVADIQRHQFRPSQSASQ